MNATGPNAVPAPEILAAADGFLAYDDLVPENALVDIKLGPWTPTGELERLYLYLDGTVVESYPARDNGPKVVSIPGSVFSGELDPVTDAFPGDGIHTLHYVLSYVDGPSDESGTTTVEVKCSKPGGSYAQPADQVNPALAAIALEPLEADASTTRMTLTVPPWKHIAAGDRLTAYFSGEPFEFPPVTNIVAPQTLDLSQADLKTIPGGTGVLVTYRVVDKAGNRSGYAPGVVTQLRTWPQDALEVSELYYGDHFTRIEGGEEIDLEVMDGRPLEFRVNRYLGFTGETVSAFVEGRPSDGGDPVTLDLGTRTWPDPAPSYIAFDVPDEWIRNREGGNLRCWYTSDRPGTSVNTRHTIGRLPVVTPPAPVVGIATDGMLDPGQIGSMLVIQAPGGTHLTPFARCTMRIAGMTSEGESIEWSYPDAVPSEPQTSLYFFCEKEFIVRLLDRPARFSYTIEPSAAAGRIGGGRPMRSAELLLFVGNAAAPGALPAPEIFNLPPNDVLDPAQPMLRVTVPKSEAALKNAEATLLLKANDEVVQTKRFLDDLVPIAFTFPDYPQQHNGQEVDASYTVTWPDGSRTATSESKVFRIGAPAPSAHSRILLPAPDIREASHGVLDPGGFDGPAHIGATPDTRIVQGLSYWASVVSSVGDRQVQYTLANNAKVSAAEVADGLRTSIPRTVLDGLPDGSALTVRMAVNLAGTDDPVAGVATFQSRTYVVRKQQQ